MTSNALTYAVHIADGMPTTNADVPPDQRERSWSPTSSILISSEGEALLVDPLFTIAQSEGLLHWLNEREAPVTSVYVTHGHGDHWFGLGAVLQQYPGARAFALPEVVEDMAYQSSPEVLKVVWRAWFPEQIPEQLVLAEPLEGEVLTVGGAEVRPVRLGHTDSDNTTCLHVPDLGLIVAGDVIYNNVHLMLAASDADGRAEWLGLSTRSRRWRRPRSWRDTRIRPPTTIPVTSRRPVVTSLISTAGCVAPAVPSSSTSTCSSATRRASIPVLCGAPAGPRKAE